MIVDSCILIDVSRRLPAALDYLAALEASGIVPAVAAVTVTEIMRGVRMDHERELFEAFFQRWTIIPIDLAIALKAAEFLKAYHASHRLDIIDALIAATASVQDEPLVTLNLKHFPMFPGLARPY
ncbi:type II toxin-antitoxin system VapC family toxin [Rhizobium sp. LjRoot254]|uniref:type II toxin-antitoxin system VapC family toxin n=1 Tax=Rhizobium sp. LjRoot254 TaxID=3342297 RepID=UPI003ED0C221